MSIQKESKNKIGARCLSASEAELIMPNYKRIYDQIDQFRAEKRSVDNSEGQKVNGGDKDQKTNNIGIMGVRGAGKTSILKTIRVQLEKNKQALDDIILPIIVPENMSESGTLMATVLGMLNEVIKERDEKEKKRQKRSNIDCIKEYGLRKKYDELIKQYTYIQKEYRDILIRQYTTEGDYVNRSARVFNSDTEFINKFNELVDELVNAKRHDSSLLFLFIDDIDLSTYRCADVVKTLLSYLSNENIVTFISGDLETFEEALTLDFLRQENVLNKDILEKEIGSDRLIDSKKNLAYEYLKKIIPPAYRYNIKHWSLAEKGNYCIEDGKGHQTEEVFPAEVQRDKGQRAGKTLSELLVEKLKGWVDPAFFCYAEIGEDAEGRSPKETGNQNLPYTYYLFDTTSRGLNNVYNVLGEISVEKKEQGKDYSKEKKLLLDTIISSNKIYDRYRHDIQFKFFHIGTNADSRVFFDNAAAVIYEGSRGAGQGDNSQSPEEDQEMYHIKNPIERFSLFILVDFAARLLYEVDHYEKKIKEDGYYKILKDKAMKDLLFHPIIAEKVMEVPDYSWESEDASKLKKESPALENMKLKDINNSFLLKGDLTLNLAYYKNLPLDGILRLYERLSEGSDEEMFATAELEQSVIIAIWSAFLSIAKVNGKATSEMIARYYSVFWKEFAYIRNQLSSSVTQNIVLRLFEDEINAVVKKEPKPGEKKEMIRLLSNTLARILAARDEDEIEEDWKEICFDDLYVVEKNREEKKIEEDTEREDLKRRIQILKVIDSNMLWQAEVAGSVADYLKEMVKRYLRFIKMALEEQDNWKLKTSDADGSWQQFEKADVGVSKTIAKRTRNNVRMILSENNTDFQKGMSLKTYRAVIRKLGELAGNRLVWYGQSEAQQILNELQKATAEPNSQDWDTWMGKHSYFAFLLQCYYKYKLEAGQSEMIVQNAHLLSDIAKKLPDAHKEADRQTLENFIDELNKGLEDKIDSEGFEKLFSL